MTSHKAVHVQTRHTLPDEDWWVQKFVKVEKTLGCRDFGRKGMVHRQECPREWISSRRRKGWKVCLFCAQLAGVCGCSWWALDFALQVKEIVRSADSICVVIITKDRIGKIASLPHPTIWMLLVCVLLFIMNPRRILMVQLYEACPGREAKCMQIFRTYTTCLVQHFLDCMCHTTYLVLHISRCMFSALNRLEYVHLVKDFYFSPTRMSLLSIVNLILRYHNAICVHREFDSQVPNVTGVYSKSDPQALLSTSLSLWIFAWNWSRAILRTEICLSLLLQTRRVLQEHIIMIVYNVHSSVCRWLEDWKLEEWW